LIKLLFFVAVAFAAQRAIDKIVDPTTVNDAQDVTPRDFSDPGTGAMLSVNAQKELIKQDKSFLESSKHDEQQEFLNKMRAEASGHRDYRDQFAQMQTLPDQDKETVKIQKLAEGNAIQALDLSNRRSTQTLQYFPERAFNDMDKLQQKFTSLKNVVYARLPGTSSFTQYKARMVARASMSPEDRAALSQEYDLLREYRDRNARLAAAATDPAVKEKLFANVAAATTRITNSGLKGFKGRQFRNQEYNQKQIARVTKLLNMYKTRLYDPRFNTPEARAAAQNNIDRGTRLLQALNKATFDSQGWVTSSHYSIPGQGVPQA
jgi:hypothetical protein